jgi:hypothetical protein
MALTDDSFNSVPPPPFSSDSGITSPFSSDSGIASNVGVENICFGQVLFSPQYLFFIYYFSRLLTISHRQESENSTTASCGFSVVYY